MENDNKFNDEIETFFETESNLKVKLTVLKSFLL